MEHACTEILVCAVHIFHIDVSFANIHHLAFCRGSHKKEERNTKEREGAGAHTGQEKPGFSGHPPVCKSIFSSVLFWGFFSPEKQHCSSKISVKTVQVNLNSAPE